MANQKRRGSNVFRRPESVRPSPEALEARRLLAVLINEFGGLVTAANPSGITSGPDNALWFTEPTSNQIGRIDTSGTVSQFSTGISAAAGLASITEGPASGGTPSLYFTEATAGQIGSITTQGVVTEYPISGTGNSPQGITLGPDGNLWVADNVTAGSGTILPPQILSFSPTGTLIHDYGLSEGFYGSTLSQITTGPDGSLWFTIGKSGSGVIGTVTTAGLFSFYTIPNLNNGATISNPVGIVSGFNNDLWFTDPGNSAIGQITTTGSITEYTQGLTSADIPTGITQGPDGNYWFTDPSDFPTNPIGQITPNGVITLYPTPTSSSGPMGITQGPDKNLWFTESAANQIGQVVLPQSLASVQGAVSTAVATVSSTFPVATFQDSPSTSSANFSAMIDYGDGIPVPGVVLPLGSTPGAFEVVGTRTFPAVGSYSAMVTISTATGSLPPVTATINATSPIQLTGLPVDGIAGRRSNTGIASFTDQDTSATAANLVATVDWGDGSTSTAVVRLSSTSDAGSFLSVFDGHVFAGAGSFVNTLTIVDTRNGIKASTTFTATIAASPTFTAINEIGPSSLTPGADPTSITKGPDGALWFTETGSNAIGRVDPSGKVTQFLPETSVGGVPGFSPGSEPLGITTGPDGNLWFTEASIDRIARLTPGGLITEFSTGITPGSFPEAIVAGPDGNLWFTESLGNRIARITPQGVVTEFAAGLPQNYYPDSITSGPDGNLWFVGQTLNTIGRISPQGVITLYDSKSTGSTLGEITKGPDGDLWFTEPGAAEVGKINPTTAQVTEYSTAGLINGSKGITGGPDGALYFAAQSGSRIGRITTSGVVTTLTVGLTANLVLGDLATGPDSNVYFTESNGDRIGQIVLPQSSLTSLVAPTINAVAGQSFSQTVATFTEASTFASTANFDAVINWGDGTNADVVVTQGMNGQIRVLGSHDYLNSGTYTGTIGIFNDAGSRLTNFTVNVALPTLMIQSLPITEPADRVFTVPVARFDPPYPTYLSGYLATIDWGDGTTSIGSVSINSALGPPYSGQVFGTHSYRNPGTYNVTTTIDTLDRVALPGVSTAPATVVASILSASVPTIQARVGDLFQGAVAFVTNVTRDQVNAPTAASIDWGDGTPPTGGTIVPLTDASFEVIGSHTYARPGTFSLTVVIDRPGTGDFTSASGTALVAPALSFVVTNTNDSGAGSLRQTILNADSVGGHAITFAIPTSGVATINVPSPLPTITGPTVIDARTQASFEGVTTLNPLVEINGQVGTAIDGLTFGPGAVASGLAGVAIYGFPGAQVAIDASSVGLISNYVGLRADGTIPVPIGGGPRVASFANVGIRVDALDAFIGDLGPGDGNTVSGNDGWGILLEGTYFGSAHVIGNRVGLDPTGQAARPNLFDGIAVMNGAGYETIGPGNTISGNAGNGINLFGTVGDVVEGNDIGTNAGATRAIPNGIDGIAVYGSSIQIGGPDPSSGNIISGNAVAGVAITNSSSVRLGFNRVGTDGSGKAALGNGIAGVLISDSSNNTVGPGNLVSGNGTNSPGAGIWIDGPSATSNLVIGNKVGTDLTGQFAIPNAVIGILINQGSGNEIGGLQPGDGNLISGNTSIGVMIAGPSGSNNLLAANLIGTDASGTRAIGNGSSTQGAGVYIDNASGNSIGGPAGSGNLISGNHFDGAQIFGPSSVGNVFQNNLVGTNLAGTGRLGNAQDGLVLNGAPGTHVLDNILAANGLDGITVTGAGTSGTLIQGNRIGQGDGGQALGNATFGLLVINGAPLPTQSGNLNVNNKLGPIRVVSPTGSSSTASTKSTAPVKKAAVVHGKAHPRVTKPSRKASRFR